MDWLAVILGGICFVQTFACIGVILEARKMDTEEARTWEKYATIGGVLNASVFLLLTFCIK